MFFFQRLHLPWDKFCLFQLRKSGKNIISVGLQSVYPGPFCSYLALQCGKFSPKPAALHQFIPVISKTVQNRKLELPVGQKNALMLGMYVYQLVSQGLKCRHLHRAVVYKTAGPA